MSAVTKAQRLLENMDNARMRANFEAVEEARRELLLLIELLEFENRRLETKVS